MNRAIEPTRPAALAVGDELGVIAPLLAQLESRHTVRAYKRHLRHFLAWYASQGQPGLSKAVVGAYKAHLLAAGTGASVINQALAAIRKLANEAADNGHLSQETARAIGRVESVKAVTLPAGRSISSGELYALLSACGSSVSDIRDAAAICLLYSTGMRRGELVGLDLADYDPDSSELRILHGKGNKQRTAPIEDDGTRAALGDWLTIRGDWPGPLFCPVYRSGHIKQARLTTQAVYHLVEKRASAAGIKAMSPHDFRRTLIGDLLDRGADIATVQQLVGHANVTTTARYDRRGDAAKRKAVKMLHVPYQSKFNQQEK